MQVAVALNDDIADEAQDALVGRRRRERGGEEKQRKAQALQHGFRIPKN